MELPPLPPGAVLDAPVQADNNMPPLPAGAVLDAPAATDPVQDTRIDMDSYRPEVSAVESGIQGFRDAATLGFGNELTAGFGALVDQVSGTDKTFGESYDDELNTARDVNVEAQAQNPNAYTTGEVAGIASTAVVPGGAIGRGAGTVLKATKGAGDALVRGGSGVIGKMTAPLAGPAGKIIKETAGKISPTLGRTIGNMGAKNVLPQTMGEGVSFALGFGAGGLPGGAAAVAGTQFTKNLIKEGAKSGMKAAVKKSKPGIKSVGMNSVMKFKEKYGSILNDAAARSGTAGVTSTVYVMNNQNPEFREMLRAAKKEAQASEQ